MAHFNDFLKEVKVKNDKKYKMLMLPEHVHKMLKDYCDEKDFIMSSFVSALIRQAVKNKNS